jgi:phosphoribosylformylglycinamidine (FGAM) synthase-like amidotransferase family enzyme
VGMMPHPERCVLKYHYPDWTDIRGWKENNCGFGFKFFQNVVKYVS